MTRHDYRLFDASGVDYRNNPPSGNTTLFQTAGHFIIARNPIAAAIDTAGDWFARLFNNKTPGGMEMVGGNPAGLPWQSEYMNGGVQQDPGIDSIAAALGMQNTNAGGFYDDSNAFDQYKDVTDVVSNDCSACNDGGLSLWQIITGGGGGGAGGGGIGQTIGPDPLPDPQPDPQPDPGPGGGGTTGTTGCNKFDGSCGYASPQPPLPGGP